MMDFTFLLASLALGKKFLRISDLRKTILIEFGPGPTRCAFIKRLLFRRVFFLDRSDYGIPDSGLKIVDLEAGMDAGAITTELGASGTCTRVMFFADHCLEHIPEDVLLRFFDSLRRSEHIGCFRMPNICSPTGHQNFMADPTHRTSFDRDLRRRLKDFGFTVSYWMRWYRLNLIGRMLTARGFIGDYAEEIVVSIATPMRADS
jgi:hypothetical protein